MNESNSSVYDRLYSDYLKLDILKDSICKEDYKTKGSELCFKPQTIPTPKKYQVNKTFKERLEFYKQKKDNNKQKINENIENSMKEFYTFKPSVPESQRQKNKKILSKSTSKLKTRKMNKNNLNLTDEEKIKLCEIALETDIDFIKTSTGFSTVDYNEWPELSRTLITLLMFIGACAGSTGGGIKVSRIIILCKSMGKELETLVHPHQVKKITMDSRPVGHDVVRSVNVYMVCYILVYVVSLIILSFNETDLITNFTAVASAINNIGPGLERVGPAGNFGFYSDISKLVIIFDMLAGRLELYPILMLLAPVTWKKR